jgi:BirA family biotin operon repressor/biotin-[acetyl-CoA-carboxylase] ligase
MERAMAALESKGLAGIYPQYESRSVTLGRMVRVSGAGESFMGVAEKLDAEGALHVRVSAGNLRRVLSGDVSVRGVMGYV